MAAVSAKLQRYSLRDSISVWRLVLVAGGVAGIVMRIWVYRSALDTPDADEGVVGLTARHILDGQFPAFIWGLKYGGIQECLAAAGLFLVFGSSWLALRMVPIALTAVTAFLVWRVGRRTIGEPAASVAGALFWVWLPYNFFQLTHEHGYYGSDVFYCALILLLALRAVEEPSTQRVGLFGLVLGLAFWQTSQVVPVMVPAVAWTIWRQPKVLRKLWIALPLAVLGAMPWLIWNIEHGWASLNVSYPAHSSYWHRLRIYASPLLPMIMGLRQFFTQTRVVAAPVLYFLLALFAGLFAYGAVKTRRRDASLLFVVALVFPFVYAISEWTIESSDPRYLIPITPVLPLLFAQLATTRLRGAVLLVLGTITSIVVLHHAIVLNSGPVRDPPRNFAPLIAELDKLNIHYIFSTHWVVYKLAFETKERIIGSKNEWGPLHWNGTQAQVTPDTYIRYEPWERATSDHLHAFVFYRDQPPPVIPQLKKFGYHAYDVGTLVIYWLPRFSHAAAAAAA